MAILQDYYLEDFDEYANERFPDEYNALRDCQAWTMQFKTIDEGIGPLKRVPMLLVGRYFFSHGKQNAWAWSTGSSIRYYHAHGGTEIVSPLGGLQNNKVYYDAPLVWAAGDQDTMHGMTKARYTTKALAELVINFMFLAEDKIVSVPNPGNRDLLSDFEYACRMFAMRREEERNDPRDEFFAYYGDAYGQTGIRGFGSRRSGGSSTSSTSSYMKDEPRDDDAPSSRLSGSPYRSTTSSASNEAKSAKSYATSGRSRPSAHIKQERNDDEGAASVSWSGSSYTSTPSSASSTPYLGMFTPNASTIRSGNGTSTNPFRLPLDHTTVKPRVSTHNRPSNSFTTSAFSQLRRTSSILIPPAQPTERGADIQSQIKIEPDEDRRAREQAAGERRRRQNAFPVRPTQQTQDTSAVYQARAERIRALKRMLPEDEESEERSVQRTKVKQEAEEADIEEIW